MYNWSIDEEKLKKRPEKYRIWKLEQQLNFGLGENKISEAQVRRYLARLHLDPGRKKFIQLLLDVKKDSH